MEITLKIPEDLALIFAKAYSIQDENLKEFCTNLLNQHWQGIVISQKINEATNTAREQAIEDTKVSIEASMAALSPIKDGI